MSICCRQIPGFVSILALRILYAGYRELRFVDALSYGLAPAVMAVVVEAVIRIGKRALKNTAMFVVAGLAFLAIFFFAVPFPLVVLAAALTGLAGVRLWPEQFLVMQFQQSQPGDPAEEAGGIAISDSGPARAAPSIGRSFRVLAIWLTLWLIPLAVLAATQGWDSLWVKEGVFFSKAAVVTFGGAYAVLAYIAQQAVNTNGWLQPGEMLHGLGMAETTPGPLIPVVQFVGFMGAYRAAEAGQLGDLTPMVAGAFAAVLKTWVTFTPCFLWIFLGAPYIERLRGHKSLTAALSTITAAVVGVIVNLAVWFALHTIFGQVHETRTLGMRLLMPVWNTIDFAALLISVGAFIALFALRLGMINDAGGGCGGRAGVPFRGGIVNIARMSETMMASFVRLYRQLQ